MDVSSSELRTVSDFEKAALDRCLDDVGKIYFSAGANTPSTPKDNEEALKSYRIVPRMLRDVAGANLECNILGNEMCSPIGVSPTGCLFLAHPQAEVAAVRGCLKEGCIFILSCLSSTTLEEVANIVREVEGNQAVLWLQLYIFRNRSLTLNLVKKAEELNFSAIVVSVDSPIGGLWKNVMPQNFLDVLKHKLLNIPGPARQLLDDTLTFQDLVWLKEHTKLRIVAKGIMTGEDALEAAGCGVSAVFVSNHGGRQIERVIPTINVLEEVVEAVKDKGVEVYFDGGVRSGSDIFIAIALGANAVFVGRPTIWGLSVQGEEGVRKVLQILKRQLMETMKLAGVSRVQDIKKSMVRKIAGKYQ